MAEDPKQAEAAAQPEGLKQVGRRYRGEPAVIRTAEEVAVELAERAPFAAKPGAIPIAVYFIHKSIDNPILQASMLAFTVVRVATPEDFDEIFDSHHNSSTKPAAENGEH